MSHNLEIALSDNCQHLNQFEYWHENEVCGVEDCAVNECSDCGQFTTECWEDWQPAEYSDTQLKKDN